jgi:hypothetical protein
VAVGFLGAAKKDKAHDDLVADFFMYLSSPEGWTNYQNAIIAAGGTLNGPPLVYGAQLPGDIQSLFSGLSFIGNVQKGYSNKTVGVWGNNESGRAWYDLTYNYLSGKITIDQWVLDIQALADRYFDVQLKSEAISRNDLNNPQNAPTGQ